MNNMIETNKNEFMNTVHPHTSTPSTPSADTNQKKTRAPMKTAKKEALRIALKKAIETVNLLAGSSDVSEITREWEALLDGHK